MDIPQDRYGFRSWSDDLLERHVVESRLSYVSLHQRHGWAYAEWAYGARSALQREYERRGRDERRKQQEIEVAERRAVVLGLRADGLTFEQIGEHLNITRERVRQLHKAALSDPRAYLLFVYRASDFFDRDALAG